MSKETYEKEIQCPNCKLKKTFDIPKGKTISSFQKSKTCENCGCSLDWFDVWRRSV